MAGLLEQSQIARFVCDVEDLELAMRNTLEAFHDSKSFFPEKLNKRDERIFGNDEERREKVIGRNPSWLKKIYDDVGF